RGALGPAPCADVTVLDAMWAKASLRRGGRRGEAFRGTFSAGGRQIAPAALGPPAQIGGPLVLAGGDAGHREPGQRLDLHLVVVGVRHLVVGDEDDPPWQLVPGEDRP